MLSALKPCVYIQVAPDCVLVRNAKTGASLSEPPQIAFSTVGKTKVLAVGSAARSAAYGPDTRVVNPFGHPRSLVSDFVAGQQLLEALMPRVLSSSFLAVAPAVVLHLMGDPAGGFTQVEVRAFHEMALGAGASEVIVWQGPTLTDQQLLSRQFPAGGQILS